MQMFTKRQNRQEPEKREAVLEGKTRQPKIQRLKDLKRLPKVLSSSIKEKYPGNLFEIRAPGPLRRTGFDEIAWIDQDGSKLYLENLDSEGRVFPGEEVTYPEVQSLRNMSGWRNLLPDTIYVNSGGGPEQRMAAKKMVLGLLKKSYQSDKKPPKPIILKETQTDNVGPSGLAIEFSVKNITQLDPIMMQDDFGQEIKFNTRYAAKFGLRDLSPMLEPINEALTSYQAKLQAGVENGFRVEGVDAAPEARAMFQEIKTAAKILKARIEGLDAPVLDKLKTLKTLKEQVESAINDGFKNELDTRRWQQWLDPKLKPLIEDVIVPGTKEEIGAGVQGSVFKYELDPALGRSPVVLKYDNNGLNGNAAGAGIPEVNPQQSIRAVAAYQMSEHLQLDIIPQTEFFVGTDADGRPKLGQAMEVVNGAVGQRRVATEVAPDQKFVQDLENTLKNPNSRPEELRTAESLMPNYVRVKNKWYKTNVFPVDIDYGNRVVQKGLSDLQVFDYIIGHADRNPGNWIYEKDDNKNITRVKGIDNDDTFGERWLPASAGDLVPRGIPPIVDISTALSILNADFAAIRPSLAGLSDEEIAKAAERFGKVQQEVGQRVMSGKIASKGDDALGDQAKLEQLRILTNMPAQPAILRWGNETAGDHTETNSYLGFQLARINELAQKYQVGVVPESGPVVFV